MTAVDPVNPANPVNPVNPAAPPRPQAPKGPAGAPLDTLTPAYPPETLEGWYALHQIFTVDPARVDTRPPEGPAQGGEGWSAFARLIGSKANLMVVHFRPTLDEIAD